MANSKQPLKMCFKKILASTYYTEKKNFKPLESE